MLSSPLRMTPGVLPSDGGTGLHLGPGDLGALARRHRAFGDEVEDSALAGLGVAGVPVLDRAVLDGGVVAHGDKLDYRGVELVLVAHGCGAALEVADVGALLGDDKGPLELAGVLGVDAEVGGELHRAADALGHVHERAVGEDRAVEGGVVVVAIGDDRAEVLLDEFGVLLDRLLDAHEEDAKFGELFLERGDDGDRVDDRIYRNAAQVHGVGEGVGGTCGVALDVQEDLLLLDRDAELLEGAQNLGIGVLQGVQQGFLLGRGVVADRLEVDGLVVHVGPRRLLHGEEVAVRLQAPVEQPLGLVLLGGDGADRVLVEADGKGCRLRFRRTSRVRTLGWRIARAARCSCLLLAHSCLASDRAHPGSTRIARPTLLRILA